MDCVVCDGRIGCEFCPRTWIVPATATAVARIEVEATSEDEAVAKAREIGGFEIADIDELLDFQIEPEAEPQR